MKPTLESKSYFCDRTYTRDELAKHAGWTYDGWCPGFGNLRQQIDQLVKLMISEGFYVYGGRRSDPFEHRFFENSSPCFMIFSEEWPKDRKWIEQEKNCQIGYVSYDVKKKTTGNSNEIEETRCWARMVVEFNPNQPEAAERLDDLVANYEFNYEFADELLDK